MLFVYGVGGGIYLLPNMKEVMRSVPDQQQGASGAVQRIVQNIAIVLGTSIATSLMSLLAKRGKGNKSK